MRNKNIISIVGALIVVIVVIVVLFAIQYTDKQRCINNGGTYIWEFSYGNKCHLNS